MEQTQIIRQMLELGQATFTSAFNANVLFQDQVERVTNTMLDQTTWLPPEGRKAIGNWVTILKSSRDNYKRYVDESYKQAQEILAEQKA